MQGVRRDRYYNIQRRANAKDGIRHIACATGMDRNTIKACSSKCHKIG